MEEAKKPSYKFCLVPECKNTTRKTPDKVFFRIPSDMKIRKQWCKKMRRVHVSPISCLYCCEDHFNVKEDSTNYLEYTLLKEQGEKCKLRLKKGVVPHIFLCQKRNLPPPVRRMGIVKRHRLELVNEAPSEYDFKMGNVSAYEPVCDIYQAGPSTSSVELSNNDQAEPCTSHTEVKLQSDKAMQVNIKPKLTLLLQFYDKNLK